MAVSLASPTSPINVFVKPIDGPRRGAPVSLFLHLHPPASDAEVGFLQQGPFRRNENAAGLSIIQKVGFHFLPTMSAET